MKNIENLLNKAKSFFGSSFNLDSKIPVRGIWTIEMYRAQPDGTRDTAPFDGHEFSNLVTNVGGALILDAVVGAAYTSFSNANAHIGVGDSIAAAAVGQTDLQATTNKLRKVMNATFPSRAGQIMTFKSTFGTADANFTWNEIGLFNAATAGSMLSRALLTSPVTKTAGLSIDSTYSLSMP